MSISTILPVAAASCFNSSVLGTEYSNERRLESVISDNVLVIHSLWRKIYETHLAIVDSDIYASPVGILCRNPESPAVKALVEEARKFLDGLASPS